MMTAPHVKDLIHHILSYPNGILTARPGAVPAAWIKKGGPECKSKQCFENIELMKGMFACM